MNRLSLSLSATSVLSIQSIFPSNGPNPNHKQRIFFCLIHLWVCAFACEECISRAHFLSRTHFLLCPSHIYIHLHPNNNGWSNQIEMLSYVRQQTNWFLEFAEANTWQTWLSNRMRFVVWSEKEKLRLRWEVRKSHENDIRGDVRRTQPKKKSNCGMEEGESGSGSCEKMKQKKQLENTTKFIHAEASLSFQIAHIISFLSSPLCARFYPDFAHFCQNGKNKNCDCAYTHFYVIVYIRYWWSLSQFSRSTPMSCVCEQACK